MDYSASAAVSAASSVSANATVAVAAVMLAAIEAARRIANKDFLFISFSSFFCISG